MGVYFVLQHESQTKTAPRGPRETGGGWDRYPRAPTRTTAPTPATMQGGYRRAPPQEINSVPAWARQRLEHGELSLVRPDALINGVAALLAGASRPGRGALARTA